MDAQLFDYKIRDLTVESLMVDQVIESPYAYEEGLVKYIDSNKSYVLIGPTHYLDKCDTHPIKIEGYDRLNFKMYQECRRLADWFGHKGHVSCHLFLSPKGSRSFDTHTDPDDVVILMIRGSKVFELPQETFELTEGSLLYIPKGTPHRAVNTNESTMLSFGLEQFLEKKL